MAIQSRRGLRADFDSTKMLPGEWAVSIDSVTTDQIIWMCFAPGVVKRIATYEDMIPTIDAAVESATATATQKAAEATAAQSAAAASEQNAAASEANAAQSASSAQTSATNAASSASSAATSADNASTSEQNAADSATSAAQSALYASERIDDAGYVYFHIDQTTGHLIETFSSESQDDFVFTLSANGHLLVTMGEGA